MILEKTKNMLSSIIDKYSAGIGIGLVAVTLTATQLFPKGVDHVNYKKNIKNNNANEENYNCKQNDNYRLVGRYKH